MRLAGQGLPEGDRGELAVLGRQPDRRPALDEPAGGVLTRPATVTVLSPCCSQYGIRSGTRAIVRRVHDLADDARRVGPAGGGSTAASVRPIPQHPPGFATAGTRDPAGRGRWLRVRRDRDLDRVAAVGGGDAGRHPVAGLDRDRERYRAALRCSRSSAATPAGRRVPRSGRQTGRARVRGHEVDRLGRRELGGDTRSPFVSRSGSSTTTTTCPPDLLDRLLDRRKRCRDRHR